MLGRHRRARSAGALSIPLILLALFGLVLLIAPASLPRLVSGILLPGLTLAALFFLLAAGLSLIFGLMDVLNFAHGSLFMLGAYIAWSCNQWLDPGASGHWPVTLGSSNLRFMVGLVLGTAGGAAAGGLIERALISRLYSRPLYQVLLTLGLAFVINTLVRSIPAWGPDSKAPIKPAMLSGSLDVLGRRFASYNLFLIVLGAGLALALALLLRFSRLGLIIRAGVQDRAMVEALGINVRRVFSGVFALGAALAALAGAAAASYIGVYPEMALEYQLLAFIVVVVGGMGSYAGAASGALLLGLARTFSDHLVLARAWPSAIASASPVLLLALVLLLRPGGIFGRKP